MPVAPEKLLLAAAVAAVVTAAATPLVRRRALRGGLLDEPNPRSSHARTTPRGGGVALLVGLGAGVAVAARPGGLGREAGVLLALAAGIALLGLLDDRFRLSPTTRLLCQLAAAAALALATGGLPQLPLPPPLDTPLGPLAVPLATLWIVAVVNFYNFMDGIDGLASVQGVLAGLAAALAGWDVDAALVAAALAGACAGFLPHNWTPATIFLGDVGSYGLGFLLAGLPLVAPPERSAQAVLLTALALWFFLADAGTCLLRRLARGERVFEAHRQHLYQRWVAAGLSHPAVTLRLAAATFTTAAAALLAWRGHSSWWLALGLATALFAVEWLSVVRRERSGARRAATNAPDPRP